MLFFRVGHVAGSLAVALVGGPALVIVMHHLGFIKRQVAHAMQGNGVALEDAALAHQRVIGTEQAAVVGHMEHRLEANPPRILLRLPIARLTDQHRGAAVELLGQCRIRLRAK
ncbi:hypothetical protein D3C78_1689080 [compost metagenome]